MCASCFLLCFFVLFAQEPKGDRQNLQTLGERLRSAIDHGDWKKAAVLSSSLKNAVIEERDRTLARNSKEQIDRLIDALPEDTETIVAAQQPFTLSEPNPNAQPDALTTSRGYILGLLGTTDEGKTLKALYGSTLRFAMLAGRKFANHPSDGSNALPLGLIAYEGCAVYAFANPIEQSIFSGLPDSSIATHRVWISPGKQYTQARDATPRNERYFTTLLRPDLMLVCNSKDLFSSVIASLDKPSKNTLLQGLPEWKRINRSAPVWGLRHFKDEAAATDPTYPSNGGIFGTKLTGAIGATFEVGLPTGGVHALWLSASGANPWKELITAPDMRGAATMRALADGTWELSVGDNPQAGFFAVFAIMGVLGFAILV